MGGAYFEDENKQTSEPRGNQGRPCVAYLSYLFFKRLLSLYGIVNIDYHRSQIKSTLRFIVQDERMKDERLGWMCS